MIPTSLPFSQMGTPEMIYEHPCTRFAAEFIGQTNILSCRVVHVQDDGLVLEYAGRRFPARKAEFDVKADDTVCLALRTERMRFSPEAEDGCALPGMLVERRYAGGAMRATIRLEDGHEVLAMCGSAQLARGEVGQQVFLSWNPDEAPVVRG